ncbi:lipoyl synthase [Candidatus Riflebacteria bacterium]
MNLSNPTEKRNSKPSWLKIRLPDVKSIKKIREIQTLLSANNVNTVCISAKCQNLGQCWGDGCATFLIMGDRCTRNCAFCAVTHARPSPLDPEEPMNIARAVQALSMEYIVLTSVDRDDLPDGGSNFFKTTIETIKKVNPKVLVEVLIPDFNARDQSLAEIIKAGPAVVGHNLETVDSMTELVRDKKASYRKSLLVLEKIKKIDPLIISKSGIMLGYGESIEEVTKTILDLKAVQCDILTISQYLPPSTSHLPVVDYIHPVMFNKLEEIARAAGFKAVFAGPLIRSSFKARDAYESILSVRGKN